MAVRRAATSRAGTASRWRSRAAARNGWQTRRIAGWAARKFPDASMICRGGDRRDRPERREAPLPLPDLNVSFTPDEKGVESLSRQIKISGRSFPLFDIAQMILQKPERHQVTLEVDKKPDGSPVQPMFLCALDDTLWLSEDEAVNHVLEKHFGTFYQAEKTPTEPPKGTYTFVAQCGMSGIILGPPNYHDYQNQLRKLHTEQFSRMPFDAFKARVKIVKDEAVVKKWTEDQSVKTEYVCLNVPEPLRLATREEVEKHFREVHLPTIVKQVECRSICLTGRWRAAGLHRPDCSGSSARRGKTSGGFRCRSRRC